MEEHQFPVHSWVSSVQVGAIQGVARVLRVRAESASHVAIVHSSVLAAVSYAVDMAA